jgi:hypothetical protein
MSRRHSSRSLIACTTPWKVAIGTQERAEKRIYEINATDTHHTKTPQRAYHCQCGAWHLTSRA